MYRPILLGALGLTLALLVGGLALASERGDVMKTAREHHQALLALADTPGGRARVEARLAELVDGEALAAAVIGDAPATAEQRHTLADLLGRVAAQRYRRALMKQRGRPIARVDASDAPGGAHRITIVPGPAPDRPPIELDFVMARRGGKMRMIDIYTERASLVKTYRSQFVRPRGLPRVIGQAKAELGDAPSPPPAPPAPAAPAEQAAPPR